MLGGKFRFNEGESGYVTLKEVVIVSVAFMVGLARPLWVENMEGVRMLRLSRV